MLFEASIFRLLIPIALALSALQTLPVHSSQDERVGQQQKIDPRGKAHTPAMTAAIARFIVSTEEADIPQEFYEHGKVAFLDWLGVTLAGARDPLVSKLVALSDALGGIPQSSVLGYNKKASVTQAALINGAASHALDFDDSHSVFRGHPSASIIATVFALAEKEKKSGTAMLAAYLVGLDVAVTMGKAAGDSLYERGMHNTSALGVIAAAAAAAHLLDLDFEQTTNALAIATTQAFGLKRSFGTMTKPLHAGQAAEAAVEAALLARMGFTGAQDIFEGPNGFFEVLGGSANNLALAEMGQDWGMSQLSVKYHASCHWTHGGIETIRQIQSRDGVDHATIASIEITVSPVALKTAGVVYPQVGLEGKFSIPYAAMNALVTGKTGIQGFTDEAVNNPDVRRLIEKTTVSTEDFQDWFFTRTVVRTVDGNIYRAELSVFQDLPDLEQKRIGVIKKFNELVRPLLGEEKTTQIRETILALESVKDVSNLNQSEGLQYLYELLITAVEDPMSTYTPEVWGNPASPNTSGDQQ